MQKIDPSRVLTDIVGQPLSAGEIRDSAVRLKLAEMKDEAVKAPVGEQFVLLERYELALKDAQDKLTLGSVIIAALQATMEGDEKLGYGTKVARDDLCLTIYRAERAGGEIELTAENVVTIKQRVGKLYVPRVVGQVVRCLEGAAVE